MQAQVRQRVLRAFVRRGLLDQRDGDQMGGWAHGGGFSLDATVRIAGADLAGRERLLRYCVRPPRQRDRQTTIRIGSRPPNRYRRSNSISARPGDPLLLARARSACVRGAPRRRFLTLRRSTLATVRRCAARERDFRAFDHANARG